MIVDTRRPTFSQAAIISVFMWYSRPPFSAASIPIAACIWAWKTLAFAGVKAWLLPVTWGVVSLPGYADRARLPTDPVLEATCQYLIPNRPELATPALPLTSNRSPAIVPAGQAPLRLTWLLGPSTERMVTVPRKIPPR